MKKAYFISDLHLGASYKADRNGEERRVTAFLDSIKETAVELYLLGDILDYWFEYKHVIPRGYVRFFGKLAELADAGIKITWIIGNHDIWIFDYIPAEIGAEVVDGILEREILGSLFCIQHGDAIGGTRRFRLMRSLFRNRLCQKLYSAIHPRWTVGFAHSCSKKSRINKINSYEVKGEWSVDLLDFFKRWCEEEIKKGNPAKYYLFGHLHRLYEEKLNATAVMTVLPAFPDKGEYGCFDGENFQILKF